VVVFTVIYGGYLLLGGCQSWRLFSTHCRRLQNTPFFWPDLCFSFPIVFVFFVSYMYFLFCQSLSMSFTDIMVMFLGLDCSDKHSHM